MEWFSISVCFLILGIGIEGVLIEEGFSTANVSQHRPCTPAESSRCRLYESSIHGMVYSCETTTSTVRTLCVIVMETKIDTLEMYGNDTSETDLGMLSLILPSVRTLLIRDTARKLRFRNLLFFTGKVHNFHFSRCVVSTEGDYTWMNEAVEVTGLLITNDDFRLKDLHLNRLQRLEIATRLGIAHKREFFEDVQLHELSYTNLHEQVFLWHKLPISLNGLLKLKLNFPNVMAVGGRMLFPSLKWFSLTTKNAIMDNEFLKPTTGSMVNLTELHLNNVELPETDMSLFTALNALRIISFTNVASMNRLNRLPPRIRKVAIMKSPLVILKNRNWGWLKYLKELVISHCNVLQIDNRFFKIFPELSVLNLRANELQQFSLESEDLVKLRELHLDQNFLTSVSSNLFDRALLEYVNLSRNDLEHIQVSKRDFLQHRSVIQSIDLMATKLVCSCDLLAFCALFPKEALIKGTCNSENDSHVDICKQGEHFCKPTELSRSQRSLLENTEDNVNMTDNDSDEQKAYKMLLNMNVQNQLQMNSKTTLRANYGVGFQFRGHLYGSLEKFKVHVNVYWRSFVLPRFQWNLRSFQKLCTHQDDLICAICQDFVPLVKQAIAKVKNYSKELKMKLGRLSALIKSDLDEDGMVREKRDLFDSLREVAKTDNDTLLKDENVTFAVDLDASKWGDENSATKIYQGFFPWYGGIRAVNQQHERNKAMVSAIQVMSRKQNLVKDAYVEMRNDLSLAINLIADNFQNTSRNIRKLHSLLNETNFEILRIFGEVQNALNVFQQKVYGIRILSVLTTKYLDLWAKQVHNYFVLNLEVDRLIDAVTDLSIGKLSTHLLPPDQLADIIKQVAVSLSDWHKDYVLVYTRLSQFYHYSDILYLPTERGVMMQLLWPIKSRIGLKYDLFLTSSVYVPVVTTPRFGDRESNHDFSKIKLEKKYLGVSETNFVELGSEELDQCLVVDNTYLCYHSILESDNSKLSCLTALYLNASVEEISELCSVNYYFGPFTPASSIIDAGTELLVSGLSLPWTQRCMGDRIPRKAEGSLYAILDRDSLCFCSIDAPNGFLARKITNCEHLNLARQPEVRLSYAMNSLVVANFQEELNITGEELYGTVASDFTLPPFTMAGRVSEARFLNMSAGVVKLRVFADLMKQKGVEFQSEWDEMAAFMSFSSLFSLKYWFRAVSFVGSIAGFIALILVGYMFCRSWYQQGFLQSVMLAQVGHTSTVDELCQQGNLEVELSMTSIAYLMIAHIGNVFLVMLAIFTGKQLLRLCCREARVLVSHPILRKHPEVEIFLELHAGCDRVLLYILTVRAHFSKVELTGHMTPRSLMYDDHRMYGIIRPNWKREECKIVIEGIEVDLPTMIQVPLYKKREVQGILRNVFTCSILATDGLYLYRIGDRKHEVVADKNFNPYSSLISELREREKAFEAIPMRAKSMIQTTEIDSLPSAPCVTPIQSSDNWECEDGIIKDERNLTNCI